MKVFLIVVIGFAYSATVCAHPKHGLDSCDYNAFDGTWHVFWPVVDGEKEELIGELEEHATLHIIYAGEGVFHAKLSGSAWKVGGGKNKGICEDGKRGLAISVVNASERKDKSSVLCIERVEKVQELELREGQSRPHAQQIGIDLVDSIQSCADGIGPLTPGHAHADD